jgi:hypothetical protein
MRLLPLPALLGALVAVQAGCGEDEGPAVEATTSAAVDVLVTQTIDETAGLYFEGSIPYIAVSRPDGEEVLETKLEFEDDAIQTTISLEPGEYRLTSWQRVCNANCGNLGPSTDHCSKDVVLTEQAPARIEIVLRPAEGCTLTLEQ